jgi:hypothetical protein
VRSRSGVEKGDAASFAALRNPFTKVDQPATQVCIDS